VPLSSEELWWGTTQMLFTGRLRSGGAVQANAGLLFHSPDTGIALDGVPLAFLYAHPLARHVDVYGELATVLDDGFDRWILDGGLRWGLTSALVGDAAIGWDLAVGAPFLDVQPRFDADRAAQQAAAAAVKERANAKKKKNDKSHYNQTPG
jgi:hypothetical protein